MSMDIKSEEIFITEDGVRRQLEGEELAQFLAQRELDIAETQAKAQVAEAKATQRQALLDKLGITEDEARLLLGGN
jgi:hypothetical protein